MIFVNLLPDIKIDYLRIRRMKRWVVLLSLFLIVGCFVINAWLFIQIRSKSNNIAANDTVIETSLENIRKIPSSQRILTIQNQVDPLIELHKTKTDARRILVNKNTEGYLRTMVPRSYDEIRNFKFDFRQWTFNVNGRAEDIGAAQVIGETIRYIGTESCTVDTLTTRAPLFHLDDSFSISTQTAAEAAEGVDYTFSGKFASSLFDRQKEAKKMVVPNIKPSTDEVFQPDAPCSPDPEDIELEGHSSTPPPEAESTDSS